jgi:hypothetical protein
MQQKLEHHGLKRLSREPTQLMIATRLGVVLSLGRTRLPVVVRRVVQLFHFWQYCSGIGCSRIPASLGSKWLKPVAMMIDPISSLIVFLAERSHPGCRRLHAS